MQQLRHTRGAVCKALHTFLIMGDGHCGPFILWVRACIGRHIWSCPCWGCSRRGGRSGGSHGASCGPHGGGCPAARSTGHVHAGSSFPPKSCGVLLRLLAVIVNSMAASLLSAASAPLSYGIAASSVFCVRQHTHMTHCHYHLFFCLFGQTLCGR